MPKSDKPKRAESRGEAEGATSQEAQSRQSSHRSNEQSITPRWKVRLPGFIPDQEIGMGDVITRATSRVGIAPCSGCARRAARLNRMVGFGPRR
ncbi:hypothetical protein D0Z06_24820 [Geodermatophilus marinus]|nr:hypothetical protein D0Z06_24820 [Geodermatophilus sp. LHW52908]